MLPYLNDFLKDTKYELIILARNFSNNKKNELIFYRNIFKSNKFNIEFKNKENENYKYFKMKNFFIFIRSTLGFEDGLEMKELSRLLKETLIKLMIFILTRA